MKHKTKEEVVYKLKTCKRVLEQTVLPYYCKNKDSSLFNQRFADCKRLLDEYIPSRSDEINIFKIGKKASIVTLLSISHLHFKAI